MVTIPETKLRELIGQPMSAVSFVHDYVELLFDGPLLRALAVPTVITYAGNSVTFPEPCSRDALCAIIGRAVVDVVVRETESIELQFDGGDAICIPLSIDARVGPEAAHFVSADNQPIEVW